VCIHPKMLPAKRKLHSGYACSPWRLNTRGRPHLGHAVCLADVLKRTLEDVEEHLVTERGGDLSGGRGRKESVVGAQQTPPPCLKAHAPCPHARVHALTLLHTNPQIHTHTLTSTHIHIHTLRCLERPRTVSDWFISETSSCSTSTLAVQWSAEVCARQVSCMLCVV
jgi:hypothetical protein